MRSDTRRSCHREHFNDKASLAYYALPSARAVSTTCSEIRNSSGLSFISLLWCKMHQRRQISFLSISNAFNFLFGFSQISNGTNVTDERRLQCIIPKFPLKKYGILACSSHYVTHNLVQCATIPGSHHINEKYSLLTFHQKYPLHG